MAYMYIVSDQKMDSQSQFSYCPVINMEGPVTEGQKIQCSDKRANGIGNGEIQRRIRNVPVLEERRLLALERHIKRKRRRRPYVKKMKSSEKTEQLDKTMGAPNGKMSDDPGAIDFKNEMIQVSKGDGREDCNLHKIEGTVMAALEKYEENQTALQRKYELIKDFEVQSTKMEIGDDKQQDVQFDKLVEYLLTKVKSEILDKVEDEFKNQSDGKQLKVENQIKKDDVNCMEVKQEEEKFTHVTKVNTTSPKDAGIETKHVNDVQLKKEKENCSEEGQRDLEKAKDTENKIDYIGDKKDEQSYNTLNTGSKESAQKDPELEAVKSNQLTKYEVDEGKIGFCGRNKLVLGEYDDDDEDDDDEGFMPRKLFFFSFSQFKKEETCA
nr:DNA ligase 1-like [Crassostrea gigas]